MSFFFRNFQQGNRDIMARFGFDLLDHLEAMRSKGIRNIEMDKCTQASLVSLRTWEDSNYPYRRDILGNKYLARPHCVRGTFSYPCKRARDIRYTVVLLYSGRGTFVH